MKGELMRKAIKRFILKYFDYKIVGWYLDNDGKGNYKKKYNKKWYLRRGVIAHGKRAKLNSV